MIVALLSTRSVRTLIASTMSLGDARSVKTMTKALAAMRTGYRAVDGTGTGMRRNVLDAVILMAWRRRKMMTRTMTVICPSTICGATTKSAPAI